MLTGRQLIILTWNYAPYTFLFNKDLSAQNVMSCSCFSSKINKHIMVYIHQSCSRFPYKNSFLTIMRFQSENPCQNILSHYGKSSTIFRRRRNQKKRGWYSQFFGCYQRDSTVVCMYERWTYSDFEN
jgi:hypothetical protein